MPRRTPTIVFALLLLIGTVLCSVQPAGAWYCEGQQCGMGLWGCCCAAPSPFQDGKCRNPADAAPAGGDQSALCAAGCNCAMVISSAPDCDHAPPPAIAAFEPFVGVAIFPAPITAYVAPVLTDTGSHRIEARGPPSRWIAHAFPSLRAPPAA